MDKKPFYMTTAIAYTSGKPHIGNTYEIVLADSIARFKKITFIKQKNANSWYTVVLTEGKNREIKKLFSSQGLIVNRLIRIRFGDIVLPKDLKSGEFKYLLYDKFTKK